MAAIAEAAPSRGIAATCTALGSAGISDHDAPEYAHELAEPADLGDERRQARHNFFPLVAAEGPPVPVFKEPEQARQLAVGQTAVVSHGPPPPLTPVAGRARRSSARPGRRVPPPICACHAERRRTAELLLDDDWLLGAVAARMSAGKVDALAGTSDGRRPLLGGHGRGKSTPGLP
jgi:hypothetical protein